MRDVIVTVAVGSMLDFADRIIGMSRKVNNLRSRLRVLVDSQQRATRLAKENASLRAKVAQLETDKSAGWRADGSILLSLAPDYRGTSRHGGDALALSLRIAPEALFCRWTDAGRDFSSYHDHLRLMSRDVSENVYVALVAYFDKKMGFRAG